MGGVTGCLPARDVFHSGLHENVYNLDDFTRDNFQSQHNIVPAKRSFYMIKIVPLCRDRSKNSPAKFFPNKRNGTNKRYIHTWREIPFKVTVDLRGVFWGKQYSALCINGKYINLYIIGELI